MRELDGWVYSSEPLWVQVGERALTVRRLRERVSPEGRMPSATCTTRSSSGSARRRSSGRPPTPGSAPPDRRRISSGPDEADSVVVLLEVPS